MSIEKPSRDLNLLAPFFLEKVLGALSEIQLLGHDVAIYEGFRSDERQDWLYESSRERVGPRITNAKAGQSAHNYGLAADLIGRVNGKWSWDEKKIPYQMFRKIYAKHGLEVLSWETAHVQYIKPFSNADLRNSKIADYVRQNSLQALWDMAASTID